MNLVLNLLFVKYSTIGIGKRDEILETNLLKPVWLGERSQGLYRASLGGARTRDSLTIRIRQGADHLLKISIQKSERRENYQ